MEKEGFPPPDNFGLDDEDVNHHSRQKFGYPAVCLRMYEMARWEYIWPPRDTVQTTVMANQYSLTFSVFPYVNLISDHLRLQCRLAALPAPRGEDFAIQTSPLTVTLVTVTPRL